VDAAVVGWAGRQVELAEDAAISATAIRRSPRSIDRGEPYRSVYGAVVDSVNVIVAE
jgi:hypothetical protein